MEMRGKVVVASPGGRLAGKPRPFVIVQNPQFDFADTLVVVPLTTDEALDRTIRPLFHPDDGNGLESLSCAMTNRVGAIMKSDVHKVIGALAEDDLNRLDAALTSLLGLGHT